MTPAQDISRTPLVSVAVNAGLAAIKIAAGFFGNSYALIADGIESTSDIFTSLVVWFGLHVAKKSANERHPFGYGKAEAMAGVVAALCLLAAGALIAFQSVYEILTPHRLPHWSTLVVLAAVIVIKEVLARWVLKQGEAAQSTAVQSDAWHHRADALTSAAAFIGISIGLIGGPGYEAADDWAALLACFVIVFTGTRLLTTALRELLDAAPPADFEKTVRQIALQVEGVRSVEKCRIRKSGLTYFVDIHVQVDGHATVHEGHQIGGKVRYALRHSPHQIADAIIHIEPYEAPSPSTC